MTVSSDLSSTTVGMRLPVQATRAFEDPALRPYFAGWDRDCDLRDAYRLAMEWGSAHEET